MGFVQPWRQGNERNFIDFIARDNRLKRDVLEAKAVRGMFSESDHFAVVAKVKMKEKWEFSRRKIQIRRKELVSMRLCDAGYKQAHGRSVDELLREVRVRIGKSEGISEMFEIFRTANRAAEEVVGYSVGKG